MSKHTPGPWIVQNKYDGVIPIDSPNGSPVGYQIAEVSNFNGDEQNTANAKLIAAAPDLLEALQAVLSAPNDDSVEATQSRIYAQTIARAAIRKATE